MTIKHQRPYLVSKPNGARRKVRQPARASSTIAGATLKVLLLAGLLASMLFAHGCHGNEDNELFGNLQEWMGK